MLEPTKREREVIYWICQGKTNREVAAKIGCAYRTACIHLMNVYRKFRIHTRTELKVKAYKSGWLVA